MDPDTDPALRKSHKEAEQRRRDCLKTHYQRLRDMLPNLPQRHASKMILLEKAIERIEELERREYAFRVRIAELEQHK